MKLLLALVLAAALLPGCEKKNETPSMRSVNVGVAQAVVKDVPVMVSGVGRVVALSTVAVQPQVTGRLESLAFGEGVLVRQGQLLASMDPKPFQTSLDQARSTLNLDWAKADQAGRDYLRYKDLIGKEVISQDDYEQKRTAFQTAWQQVRADQAALETARINLEYCRISSPVTGVTGYQLVKPGNTVSAYSSTLVTINQVQPVLVRFSVSEDDLTLVRQYYGKADISATARFPREDNEIKEKGRLDALDNTVDPQTGMISLQASFKNDSLILWPGQFVNVSAILATEKDRVVIPSDAVMTRQDGSFVFVVTDKSTAELRKVTTGRPSGRHEVVILTGVNPGEKVITEGVIQVAPGGPVNITQAGTGNGK